ncbi:thioredoxin fold domain-containing protein [Niabella sp. CC-SYL272]|uniref:TlpA family protein disulfide reductase n=1 Tax=Niabella agricola TaxID=2891571 RepID=UPI001F2287A1|nr:thioredoxin-like domain-containing protein [Niabella agricola]MCF3112176.1 thioredoxin fold domain-containing protein [Niabella agricola]
MKCFLCLFFLLCCAGVAFSQKDRAAIPPFKIRLTNGDGFTYEQVDKNKPLMLIYFSPSCEHCKAFTEALLKQKTKWANKQIVMISYVHIREVQAFDRMYHLSEHPDIKIGSEGQTFIVQQYYQIQQFPFVVLFNKQGRLTKMIRGPLTPEAMMRLL